MTILCSPDYAIAFDWSFQFVEWGDSRTRTRPWIDSVPARRAIRQQAARRSAAQQAGMASQDAAQAGAWASISPLLKEESSGRNSTIALAASAWLLVTSLCLFLIT